MRQFDFFYFFGSGYAYLSVMRIGAMAKQAGVAVRWRPFNVRTVMAENNIALRTQVAKDVAARVRYYRPSIPETASPDI